jgi:hypothetical protein
MHGIGNAAAVDQRDLDHHLGRRFRGDRRDLQLHPRCCCHLLTRLVRMHRSVPNYE